ncbi:hypothetical protein FOZ63_010549, partial [Perkinsus olseni]
MSATPPTFPTYGVASKLKKIQAGSVALKIVLFYMLGSICVDALEMNDAANLDRSAALRSLRFPVVGESPPNCLPPGFNFGKKDGECTYILRGPPENGSAGSYQGGVLIGSRFPGYAPASLFSTLEVAMVLGEKAECEEWYRGCTLKDVGYWVDGRTLLRLPFRDGISLDVDFWFPTGTRTGGVDFYNGKALNFSVGIKTAITVPNWGEVRAE